MTDTITIAPQSPTIVTAPSSSTTVVASVPSASVVVTPPHPQIITPAPPVSAVLVVPVAGPTGPAGPAGTGEGTGSAYTHTQVTPSTVWDIEHNLGYHPGGIRVEAAGGDTYWPQVTYLTATTVRLNLPQSINGTAHLS